MVKVGFVVSVVECVIVLSVVVDIKLEVVSARSEVEEDGVCVDVEVKVGLIVAAVERVRVLSVVVDIKVEVVSVVVEVDAVCVVISVVVDNKPEKLDFNMMHCRL